MLKVTDKISKWMLIAVLCQPGVGLYANNPERGVESITASWQQTRKISGTVTDELGPMAGAAVLVKGTNAGTVTDVEGHFLLDKLKVGDVIQFSFIGYLTQEVKYTGQPTLDVRMKEDSQQLNEVVVTALGMKREQKALGYSVTELKGDELKTNNINPVSSLQGKVAGVDISNSDGGMFGSAKILIRGASTLGNNNQPIYVVDGIILDNAISSSGNADWDAKANDYGNELKNLNPDDFETVSVLKGAAATALYGSRGLNGAVVITTKSGKTRQGLGVTFSQTFGLDHVYKQPDLQNVYGDGAISGYVDYGETVNGAYLSHDNQRQFMRDAKGGHSLLGSWQGTGFGPAFDGSPIENYDHTQTRYNAFNNNYKDMYDLGFNTNTNVAVQGGNDRTTFYSSLSYKHTDGTLSGNSFERLAMMAKASHKITDRVMLEASMSFANSLPKNPQPNIGEYFTDGTFSRAYNPAYFRSKYKGDHGGQAKNDYGDVYGDVPGTGLWWTLYENEYTQKETSVRPSLLLEIAMTNWLKLRTEANYNYYYRRNESKELGTGYANEGGSYRMGLYAKEQTNLNTTLLANKQAGDWNFGGFLRGEYYNNTIQDMSMNTTGGLVVPGQYFIKNSKDAVNYEGIITGTKRMMSVAFQGSMAWKNQLFVDVTGRNDWSSALVYTNGKGNYSYFDPSINGSWLLNETLKMPAWVSLAKVRASWAQVGNDTDAYAINTAYSLRTTNTGSNINSLEIPAKAYDPNLKPERKNAWEVGIDWRFFGSRLHLDAAYYKENTKNQIMTIDVPKVSGISQQLINAGNIQNSGVEVALNTIPFRNKNLEWSLDFTYTRNEGKIVSLHENVANYIKLTGDPDYGNYRVGSVAQVGASYGLLMSDSKPMIDKKTGLEVLAWSDTRRAAYTKRSGEVEEIGSLVPDFLGSLSTGVKWKNLSVRTALDLRFGGSVASFGSRYGTAYGYTEASLQYSAPKYGGVTWTSKYDGLTYNDGVIPNGIFAPGTLITQKDGIKKDVSGMTYQEAVNQGFAEPVHASAWHYFRNSWGQGVVNDSWYKELNYIALREISVAYQLSAACASRLGAKNMSVGFTGRNLGYLLNTMPSHENPESIRGTSATEFRARSFASYTANYMFTVNLGF